MKKEVYNEEIGYNTAATTIDGNSTRVTDKDSSESNAQIRVGCEEIFNAQREENGQHSQADSGKTTRNVYIEISIIRPKQTQRESSQNREMSREEQKENKVNKRDYEKRSERHQKENSQARSREEGEERMGRERSRPLSNKKKIDMN